MADSERLYTSSQLADELGITLQMLSRYAKAYIQISGMKIASKGREGRQFSEVQAGVLKNARDLVKFNPGTTVEDAMRRALAFDSRAVAPPALDIGSGVSTEKLTEAFRAALAQEVTAPLVAEIQALRAEVAELKNRGAIEVPSSEVTHEGKHYSPLQRFFRSWLGME